MMKHPWVTRRGSWPLRTVKEMVRMGDTPELPPVLPDLMSTLNVLDIPRQVDLCPESVFKPCKQLTIGKHCPTRVRLLMLRLISSLCLKFGRGSGAEVAVLTFCVPVIVQPLHCGQWLFSLLSTDCQYCCYCTIPF